MRSRSQCFKVTNAPTSLHKAYQRTDSTYRSNLVATKRTNAQIQLTDPTSLPHSVPTHRSNLQIQPRCHIAYQRTDPTSSPQSISPSIDCNGIPTRSERTLATAEITTHFQMTNLSKMLAMAKRPAYMSDTGDWKILKIQSKPRAIDDTLFVQ